MFRRPLMVLLGLGVIFGYGGAAASFRHHRGECHGWQERSEWQRGDRAPQAAAAPVIVQAPAAAPAAVSPVVTPQVFIIMPGAAQPMPAVVLQAAPAPVAAKTE